MHVSKGKTFRHEADHCPVCGHILNAATATDAVPQAPEPGDVTICIDCVAFITWDKDMKMRRLSDEERLQIARNEPDVYRTLISTAANIRRLHALEQAAPKGRVQ